MSTASLTISAEFFHGYQQLFRLCGVHQGIAGGFGVGEPGQLPEE